MNINNPDDIGRYNVELGSRYHALEEWIYTNCQDFLKCAHVAVIY